MTIKTIIFIGLVVLGLNLNAQESKYIEVTGSAEMFIEPDEFIFVIGIGEYWEEEFEKNKEFEDYKTKVPINEIEGQLITDLNGLGINTEAIKSTEVGNYWRYRGKEFLIRKNLEVSMTDFKLINQIISKLDRKGIEYMRIGELKHKKLTSYRVEVKQRALLAAKEKAQYLLETLEKELGDVISITEVNSGSSYWSPRTLTSNAVMESAESPQAEHEKKIKLRFEITAKFEIK